MKPDAPIEPLRGSAPIPEDPEFDVLHYDLDLAFELDGKQVAGTATLALVWGSDPDDVLRLDMESIRASAVRDGDGAPLEFRQDAHGLDVRIAPYPARGDTVTVAVDYDAVQTPSYHPGPNSSYTFTEPYGSRAWFPCHDVPWDKATLALHGTCVAGKRVVSNGLLESQSEAGGRATWNWREDHPLATYLMAAYVGKYGVVHFDDAVTPMTWYVYPEHTVTALNEFINTDDMMAFYDSTLAPWPFDKYAQVEGSFGGGMEHQSCTLLAEFIVTGHKQYEWITAHEMAHQWFGDLVTCRTWDHIWLNEGFATFFEASWQEHFYGEEKFAERMANAETVVADYESKNGSHTVVAPPQASLFSSIVYYKGCFVLYMLRSLVGREAFGDALREYLQVHAFGNADTEDLRAVMEKHYGGDLRWFFDQWLYVGTGSPHLRYLTQIRPAAGGGWEVYVLVLQIQTQYTFRLPVEVRVTTTAGTETRTVWVETNRDEFVLPFDDQPLSVVLDPDNRILGPVDAPGASPSLSLAPARPSLRVWPNPLRGGDLHFTPAAPGTEAMARVFDARGRLVAEVPVPATGARWTPRGVNGTELPPGVYYVRVAGGLPAARVVLLPR